MKNTLMLGLWRFMVDVPPAVWEKRRAGMKKKMAARLQVITPEQRQVHHFVVRELPRTGKPLPPESVAEALNMPLDRVASVLADLEIQKTFLFRNPQGEVVWAYPVTVEKTPHQVTFATGEQLYAA